MARPGIQRLSVTRQRGVSLVEVLVAVTVLAMAVTISLVLYSGARRSFKVGDNLAEQQQVIRIAFDKLTRDLAMAGLNSNPDGNPERPDEAIEAAYDTAIMLRADFDGDDPAASGDPETALAAVGGAFLSVSTGNDEIVGYVLAKPDELSPDTLDLAADVVGVPRDGVVESITVSDVAAVHEDPPYTLYRLSVAGDSTAVQRVPLVDNVKSLRFSYFDAAGVQMAAPGGADDDASKRARAAIHRVGVEIEGLTRDPDARWTDPDDSDAKTQEYRKFTLQGDVTPQNFGLFGIRDLDATLSPPTTPPPPALYPGHCDGLWVEWAPNPPADEVARYEIYYGTDSSTPVGPKYATGPSYYLAGLADGTEYYVSITAVDDSGNPSAPSNPTAETTDNTNLPEQVQGLSATDNLENEVSLEWSQVFDNETPSQPSADPIYPQMRDFDSYRVHRGPNPGFTPDLSTYLGGVNPPSDPSDPVQFHDQDVVNCRTYYYLVRAKDDCGAQVESTPTVVGKAYTTVDPEAPTNLQAYPVPGGGVRLVWDAVTRDVNGDAIRIEDYLVYRVGGFGNYNILVGSNVPGETEFVDTAVYPPTVTLSYRVRARDDCVNESLLSNAAEPDCAFEGDLAITQPAGGTVSGSSVIGADLTGGSGGYDLTLWFEQSGVIVHGPVAMGSGPPWPTYGWPAALDQPGLYAIHASARQNSDGCEQVRSKTVELN